MTGGWVKLHRQIMESETFSRLTELQQLITIYIILNANHEDGIWYDKYKNIEVPLRKGQLIISRNKIVNDWFKRSKEVTDRKVRTCLEKLEKLGFLTIETTKHYTLITICNYCVYQGLENKNDQQHVQQTSNERPTNDQQTSLNKKEEEKREEEASIQNQSSFQVIANKFIQRRAHGFNLSPADESSIQRLVNDQIPLDKVLLWIDEIFDEYQPKHRLDRITHFKYLEKGILDRFSKQQENNNKVTSPKKKDNLAKLDDLLEKKGLLKGGKIS